MTKINIVKNDHQPDAGRKIERYCNRGIVSWKSICQLGNMGFWTYSWNLTCGGKNPVKSTELNIARHDYCKPYDHLSTSIEKFIFNIYNSP